MVVFGWNTFRGVQVMLGEIRLLWMRKGIRTHCGCWWNCFAWHCSSLVVQLCMFRSLCMLQLHDMSWMMTLRSMSTHRRCRCSLRCVTCLRVTWCQLELRVRWRTNSTIMTMSRDRGDSPMCLLLFSVRLRSFRASPLGLTRDERRGSLHPPRLSHTTVGRTRSEAERAEPPRPRAGSNTAGMRFDRCSVVSDFLVGFPFLVGSKRGILPENVSKVTFKSLLGHF